MYLIIIYIIDFNHIDHIINYKNINHINYKINNNINI